MNLLTILVAKVAGFIIKLLSLGAGSTWPGHIALAINPRIARDILSTNKIKVVLVVGTNGKTTTAKLLRVILEKNGHRVIKNQEGANLLNGITSALVNNATLNGKIDADVAIFEVDENMLPIVSTEITPTAVIVLNLFRDQLDRYGEVNSIAAKWQIVLKKLPDTTQIFINGDDPQLFYIGSKLNQKVNYFGLSNKHFTLSEIPHDVDSVYCPVCGKKLDYRGISYSHLGDFSCSACGFKRKNVVDFEDSKFPTPLLGRYNLYNRNAAIITAKEVFLIPDELIAKSLLDFSPAYGRQEKILYKGKNIFMILSKNPVGFNQSIETVIENFDKKKNNIVLVLNDRIPDGTDVSWIWDVEFDKLHEFASKIFISGDRAYDMAIRMKYGLPSDQQITSSQNKLMFDNAIVYENLKNAIDHAASSGHNDDCIILATYSGMLDARNILVGRKIM